ncbi:hypothetical protein [Rhizobium sp. 2MFCol3.1]|uniref:hypothetical protein n=1 Tax=Rhizobium sp. 2MFCol3.1 TaxID=1246459 RepID=UPI0003693C21|nr:hypothetical protein [Rhizobium sp. 2MFCol3.1]
MTKTAKRIEYCVPPILVQDHASQCAAHFLNWFHTNSAAHITDVLRCGLKGSGGLVEEVEHWSHNCSEDAMDNDCDGGYWDKSYGPWTYQELPALDIAKVVWNHTRGWKAADFELYGRTTEQHSVHLEVMARWRAELNLPAVPGA